MLESICVRRCFVFILGMVLWISLSGCQLLNIGRTDVISDRFQIEGAQVIDLTPLMWGGDIVMVPFGYPADTSNDTSQLQRSALMMVKGLAETINADPESGLRVVLNEDAEFARFIVEGRIHHAVIPGWSWWLFSRKAAMAIEAKLYDRETDRTIMLFSIEQSLKRVAKSPLEKLGLLIGQRMGESIVNHYEHVKQL